MFNLYPTFIVFLEIIDGDRKKNANKWREKMSIAKVKEIDYLLFNVGFLNYYYKETKTV